MTLSNYLKATSRWLSCVSHALLQTLLYCWFFLFYSVWFWKKI